MRNNSITKLLKIPEYKVTEILTIGDKEIHIKVEAYKRKKTICSNCKKEHQKGHHGAREITVRDLPLGERQVYIHVDKKRSRCPEDEKTHVEEIEWVKVRGRVTRRMAEKVNRLTAITTNKEAGWYLGMDDEVVYRIDKEVLEEQAKQRLEPIPSGENLSIDEVSYLKYHRYLTNVIDTDRRKVIWNAEGRKSEVLDRYYEGIGEEKCEQIKSVALDGARTYISSTNRYAKNATIVYDKFHIISRLNKAVDAVRKRELNKARLDKNEELVQLIHCKQRFILFKNKGNLTKNQENTLAHLCEINKPIYEAMLLKESFGTLYACKDAVEAGEHLKTWTQQATESSLPAFQELAQKFREKTQYILNWFKVKVSSAISEGFNNKIKRLKRMAYGYRDVDYFLLKIHQHCGLLNPRYMELNAT